MRSHNPIPSHRSRIIIASAGLFMVILLGKYFKVQVIDYNKYVYQSRKNSIRQVITKAPRGIIYDLNGLPLVDNRPIFDLQVIPEDVKKDFNYDLLYSITGIQKEEIQNKINNKKKSISRFRPMLLKRHVSYLEMSKLQENLLDFPGMVFDQLPARIYPNNANLSHTLGYLREVTEEQLNLKQSKLLYNMRDIYGASGIEFEYENLLRGIDGLEYHTVDLYGRDHGIIPNEIKYNQKSGEPVKLTIDSKLQHFAEQQLAGLTGALICMNPNSGEILTLVSAPDFDLNSFVGPIPAEIWKTWNTDDRKPLMNRVINGTYPPGSVFKIVTAALVLETKKVNQFKIYDCNGKYHFGDRIYHCWNETGHGEVNLSDAIKYSCNIYFYKVIQQFRLSEWVEMSEKFGFGTPTGIDLQNESSGVVPNKKYMDEKYTSRGWAFGSLLNFVLGQGDLLTTPIQVCQMMNLIASGGKTYQPHLVPFGNIGQLHLNLKTSTWEFINMSLMRVVNETNGTGKNAQIVNGGLVYGKTGTAQNPHGEPHSWFSGFVETDSGLKMTLAVIVENGGKGSATAAPIAKEIFQKFIDLNSMSIISISDAE